MIGTNSTSDATTSISATTDASTMDVLDPADVLNVNVGVLGHVDSGKTSLVKALSTLLSTAALDKSVQSRQRGMTLDLGFSCFFLPMPPHLQAAFPTKKQIQVTLVDCPGHASLIKTIIGGAQIIDMVLLVVDAVKGWQAQTTECLVLAELTSPQLVVALNKADLLVPSNDRERLLEVAANQVREHLKPTRFANATIVGVAASVGGEKVAAVTSAGGTEAALSTKPETYNVDLLVDTLQSQLPHPKRTDVASPFLFAVDHCFPIRGRGTVLTGTVLSGTIDVGQVMEFPKLGLERKVKSMQMFKRAVTSIQQGDRAGLCVSQLDATAMERGICAAPGAVQLLSRVLCVCAKIKYFAGRLLSGSKFHVSVGHTTVMATVTFWGARELAEIRQQQTQTATVDQTESNVTRETKEESEERLGSLSLGGDADLAGLPKLSYDFAQDFLQQDGLLESLDGVPSTQPLLHWALLEFATPVYCPLHSLVIGSRLDTVEAKSGSSSSTAKNTASTALETSASSCRLAFSGRLVEPIDDNSMRRIRLYTPKERRGVISRLGDPHKRSDDGAIVRYEVFGSELFSKETNMKIFIGMKAETPGGDVGEIKSSFGTSGKFRVYFPAGTQAREGDALLLKFKRYAHDPDKAMHQDTILPAARPGTRLQVETKKKSLPKGVKRFGEVVSVKGDVLEHNGKHNLAILSGFFAPEVNIKEHAGAKVRIPSTNEEGSIVGPFGKAGKCKVSFPDGISVDTVGAKAELQL